MGYELTRFINEIDDEFLCAICTMVLEEAKQSPCDHLFCKDCIETWLTADGSCPVDRGPLNVDDLKPAARFFRNLMEKFLIKCDFQREGCEHIIKLEHLKSHAISCAYNPNAEVICDKGCNMKIRRCEYEANDCLTHLLNRVISQDIEIARLNDGCSRQQELNAKLIGDIHLQQEEITKVNDELRRLRKQIKRSQPKWRTFINMKISVDSLNILENDSKDSTAFAQSFYSLEPANSFKIHICDWHKESWMVVGLTRKQHLTNDPPGWSEQSIGYSSYGSIQVNQTSEKVGTLWGAGDIIECSITFSQNFANDRNVKVHFCRNGLFVIAKYIQLPRDGLFPIICMWGTKVEYFTT